MEHVTFFNDFLSGVVNLNPARIKTLDGHVSAVREHLSTNLTGYDGMERQGSYGLGTIIKPVNGKEYDADMLLNLEHDPDLDAVGYIDAVYDCFRENGHFKDRVSRHTRCVVVGYAGDCHLDVVPCIDRSDSQFVCNKNTNAFEVTDGAGYRNWFNDRNRETNGNLKRVVRLLKYLRDHKKNFSVKSILLTTLAGRAEGECWRGGGTMDTVPDALNTVAHRVNSFLRENDTMPTIQNPALPSEDFNRHWDETKYQNFRKKFDLYAVKIAEAFACDDHDESVKQWREVFGEDFGNLKNASTGSGAKSVVAGSAPFVFRPRKPYAV